MKQDFGHVHSVEALYDEVEIVLSAAAGEKVTISSSGTIRAPASARPLTWAIDAGLWASCVVFDFFILRGSRPTRTLRAS